MHNGNMLVGKGIYTKTGELRLNAETEAVIREGRLTQAETRIYRLVLKLSVGGVKRGTFAALRLG